VPIWLKEFQKTLEKKEVSQELQKGRVIFHSASSASEESSA
jgi:hypothetical protein